MPVAAMLPKPDLFSLEQRAILSAEVEVVDMQSLIGVFLHAIRRKENGVCSDCTRFWSADFAVGSFHFLLRPEG